MYTGESSIEYTGESSLLLRSVLQHIASLRSVSLPSNTYRRQIRHILSVGHIMLSDTEFKVDGPVLTLLIFTTNILATNTIVATANTIVAANNTVARLLRLLSIGASRFMVLFLHIKI